MDSAEIKPLLSRLLEWIQDMNWRIAEEVVDILLDYPIEIIPLIKGVFKTNDAMWKYWCLECVVKKLSAGHRDLLTDDLNRLFDQPTRDDLLEEVDKLALEILRENVV